MKTYNFYDLLRMKELPVDVHDYVKETLKPVFKKFPDIKDDFDRMLKNATLKKKYTDKLRAQVFHPNIPTLPIITLEFHHGVIKRFSLAEFYGDYCYFPNSQPNKQIEFHRKGAPNGQSRKRKEND